MKIEVWADIVCPFCYIGKRSLDLALEQFEHRDEVEVIWRSFQLDPQSAKPAAANVNELVAAKYGISVEAAAQKHADLADQADKLGLTYNFDIAIPTNSHDAHRVIKLAEQQGVQAAFVERIFAGYFGEGVDIADHDALIKLAEEVGLDAADVRTALSDEAIAEQVDSEMQAGIELGLNGVPFFVIDRVAGLAGAQPPEVLLEALTLVRANAD